MRHAKLLSLIFVLTISLGCQGTTAYLASPLVGDTEVDDSSTTSKTVRIGSIDWYVDYDAAMKVAKTKNMPLWLHFGENPG